MGRIINSLVTPFKEDGTIDYQELEKLLACATYQQNDGLYLFSLTGEGTSLSIEEKISIYQFIHKRTSLDLIYCLQQINFDLLKKEIEMIKVLPLDLVVVVCPYYLKPTQEGLVEYFYQVSLLLKGKKMMIENNPSRGVVSLCFNTIKKLYQNIDNFYGIIECSSDLHLINLIKNQMPNLKVFLGEDKLFIEGVENHLDGFISPLSLTFGKLMKEVIEDYQIGFKNELLISYLKLTHEIIYVYDIPMNIKCYLKKKKFNSMNMRLPLKEISATNQDFDLLI